MDIRVLRYFLAVTREESISRAAEALHVTQPTLSRQLRDLEDELGVTLMLRGSRSITLTSEGMHLRRRAQEIVDLADRTEAEFSGDQAEISGEIHIGGGETRAMRLVADVAVALRREFPGVRYHLYSGNADDVGEKLDSGLLDFGVLIGPTDLKKYEHLRLPVRDVWGVLMRRDDPLAAKTAVRPEELEHRPLLASRQTLVEGEIADWLGESYGRLDIVAHYNLIYNAALMVEAGMGVALTLAGLTVTDAPESPFSFRPLAPRLEANLDVVWKKYQVFSPASELFIRRLQQSFAAMTETL